MSDTRADVVQHLDDNIDKFAAVGVDHDGNMAFTAWYGNGTDRLEPDQALQVAAALRFLARDIEEEAVGMVGGL